MNTVHSFVYSGGDQSSGRRDWRVPREDAPSLSPEINRLLSAAVVSATFRRLLLRDPVAALAKGYNGESFEIRSEELAQIVLIRAGSLAEFAGELIERLWYRRSREDMAHNVSVQSPSAGTEPLRVTVAEPVMVVTGPARDARQ